MAIHLIERLFLHYMGKAQNKWNVHNNEQKTSINFIFRDMWPQTALTSIHSTVSGVSEFTQHC